MLAGQWEWRRILGVVACAAALPLVLAACGGSGNSGTSPASGASQNAGGHSAAASPALADTHGLVVCQLTNNDKTILLEVISPQNLHVDASAVVPVLPGSQSADGAHAPTGCSTGGPIYASETQNLPTAGPEQFAAREAFNADFSRIAVTISNSGGGTSDAGYMDLATGKTTDLTKASGASFGSSSGKVSDALFDPSTGDLWYIAGDGTPHSVSSTGHDTAHSVSYASSMQPGNFAPGYTSNGAFALATQTSWVLSDNTSVLPNPSGTVAIGTAGNSTGLEVWRNGTDVSDNTAGAPVSINGLSGSLGIPAPVAWIDDTHLLMLVGKTNFAVVTFNSGYTSATVGASLLPANNYTFGDVVLSPDHHTVAFLASKGGSDFDLYELALNQPGSQPKQIGPLGTTAHPWAILAWH
jgi:hypothetical protein